MISSTTLFISLAASLEPSASFRMASATTAKPFPASPALAASMDAFRDNKLVSSAISLIVSTNSPITMDFLASSSISFFTLSVTSIVASVFPDNASIVSMLFSTISFVDSEPHAACSMLPPISSIFLERESIWFRQSPASEACSDTPLSISARVILIPWEDSSILAETSSTPPAAFFTSIAIPSTCWISPFILVITFIIYRDSTLNSLLPFVFKCTVKSPSAAFLSRLIIPPMLALIFSEIKSPIITATIHATITSTTVMLLMDSAPFVT